MAENIVIYAGLEKVGKARKRAVEQEARRARKDGSVSKWIWSLLRKHGSAQFKEELGVIEAPKPK